jgi:drug/metabolite transporter (DMT)-like permease
MIMKHQKNRLLAWLFLILLSCIWGSSYILIKKGLRVFSPTEVATLRLVAGTLVLLPFSLPQLSKLTLKQCKWLFISGLLGTFIPVFLGAKAQMHLTSAVGGILNSLTPVFVLLVGVSFYKQRIHRHEAFGAILGIVGSMLLVLVESKGQLGNINYYAVIPVLMSFLYGNNINLTKFYLQNLDSRTIASVSLLFIGSMAGIILFTQTAFLTKLATVNGAYQALGYVLILGVVGLGVALVLFTELIKLSSPVFASLTSFLNPIVAIMWGILDGEALTGGHYVGMLIILLGVYFINKRRLLSSSFVS